jgi:hypothetical protein
MQARELNTQEAPTKWFAAQDARMRNIANKSRYPEAIQRQIDRMMMVMDMVYAAKGVYEAYGKKGVSIKVDGAIVKDRSNLQALEAEWNTKGFTKKVSRQGVIYRLTAV